MNVAEVKEKLSALNQKLRRQYTEYRRDLVNRLYRERFPRVVAVTESDGCLIVILTGDVGGPARAYFVTITTRDKFNNATFKFGSKVEPVALEVMANYLTDFMQADRLPYPYREVQQLLQAHWQQFYMECTAQDAMEMIHVSDRLPVERHNRLANGFTSYMTTNSYLGVMGGAVNSHAYRNWPHRDEFRELWEAEKLRRVTELQEETTGKRQQSLAIINA